MSSIGVGVSSGVVATADVDGRGSSVTARGVARSPVVGRVGKSQIPLRYPGRRGNWTTSCQRYKTSDQPFGVYSAATEHRVTLDDGSSLL